MQTVGLVMSAFLFLAGCVFLAGRGVRLLTGKRELSEEERDELHLKPLCRLIGAELIFVAMMLVVCFLVNNFYIIMVSGGFILLSAIGTAIYANNSIQSKE